MSELTLKQKTKKGLGGTIILAWLVAGTLDLTAASVQTLINGRDPAMMLKFIASGVFGMDALSGGTVYAVLGALFHYVIALGWTLLFFFLYNKIAWLSKNVVLTGVVYGLFVWLIMNRVVLPLANTPPIPFRLTGSIIAAVILIAAIGMPLSIIARRFYRDH